MPHDHRSRSAVCAAALALLAWTGCSGSDSSGPAAALSVQPDSAVLDVGGTRQFSALGQTSAVSWASTNSAVAEVVAATGYVTAKGPGSAVITASSGDRHASATVRVRAPAIVQLSSPLIQFAATGGGANPAPQTVGITNSGEQPLTDLAVGAVQYGAGQPGGWLAATISAASAPATVSLQATTGALPAGTYTASVPVTSHVAANAPQAIAVKFVVEAPPAIVATPASASFDAVATLPAPAAKTIAIANGGGGTLSGLQVAVTYAAGQPADWLGATLGGTAAPATLTLQPTTGTLVAGAYTATVRVFSSVPGVVPLDVPVALNVAAAPSIALSNQSIQFTGVPGGADPGLQTVAVTNAGGGTVAGLAASVAYGAGQSAGWLGATLDTNVAPAVLRLQPTIAGLASGSYTATVTVSSTTPGVASRTVAVTLGLALAPAIALSATSVTQNATVNGANPAAAQIAVTNAGDGTLSGLATAVQYDAGQPTGWLTAGLSATTAPATLTLQFSTTGLAAGSYAATVTVSSSLAGVASRTARVTLTMIDQPVIGLSGTSVTINSTQGGSIAYGQVTVSNAGTGTLSGLSAAVSYAAGQSTGWLSATVGPTAPTTLSLSASPALLLPGSYTATVQISSTLQGVSPVDVQVTFNVAQGAPVISLSTSTVNFGAATTSPTDQVVFVTNSGNGTLSGLSASVNYAIGQPTGWLTATLSTTTAPANLTLHVSAGSLAGGTYSATVTVSSSLSGVTPRTVTVYFTVVSFAGQVSAILNTKSCVDAGCHSTWTYSYTTSLVTPGNPAGSTLYQRITSTTSPMPPTASLATNPALTSSQVQTIYNWILEGAKQ